MGRGQLDPVHVERPAGPPRTVRRDGRQRERRRASSTASSPTLNTSRKQPYDWAGQRARARHPVGVRLRGRAVAHPGRRAAHRHRALRADARTASPATTTSARCRRGTCGRRSGCIPRRPGTADLVLASPLFTQVTITLGNGHRIEIDAPDGVGREPLRAVAARLRPARARRRAARRTYACPWLPASVITSGAQLHFTLGADPSATWGTAPAAAPPSITK